MGSSLLSKRHSNFNGRRKNGWLRSVFGKRTFDSQVLDSNAFFLNHTDHLIILDEVQFLPDIFAVLRGQVDARRRAGFRFGQFLILGSASVDLLQQSEESLAGRIAYTELVPLNLCEVEESHRNETSTVHRLWLRGGFPESFLAQGDKESLAWRSEFISTYLERDIPALGPRIPAETLRRLWTMLAYEQGEMVRLEKLAGALAVSGQTVSRYVDLLVDLLLVRRLLPWHKNTKKRLVKMPKLYCRDSGLVHALLGLCSLEDVLRHPVAGMGWEGFVIENILAVCPARTESWFYRSAAGAEIDLVLEIPGGKRWAIEIKRATNPTLSSGFYSGCQEVQADEQLIVHGGQESMLNPEGVMAMTLHDALELLQNPPTSSL